MADSSAGSTAAPDDSATSTPRRIATLLASATLVCGVAAAATVPAWIECDATRRLTAALGPQAQVRLDLGGLHVQSASVVRSDLRLSAEHVTVHPTRDGVAIHVQDPTWSRAPRAKASDASSPTPAQPTGAEPREDRTVGPSIPDTHGIPVTIAVAGAVALPGPVTGAALVDPVVQLDGRGGASISADVELPAAASPITIHGPVQAASADGVWVGRAHVGIAGGPPVAASARLDHTVTLSVDDGRGGSLVATKDGSGARVTVDRLHLSSLGSLGDALTARLDVDLQSATVQGQALVEQQGEALLVGFDPLTISNLVADDRTLSPTEVAFDPITLSGDVVLDRHDVSGQAVFAHRGLAVEAAGRITADAVDLDLTLPTVPCQQLIDGAPSGMTAAVAGTRLDGDIEGHLRLSIDRPRLANAREAGALDREHPPGELDFEFPFLERCAVVLDPPGLDFDGLRGPYRHHFRDASGSARTRVMARGAEGYVSLRTGRLLADSFVTLEDYRFWDHDGFDREQIQHAFWHNLVVGRVSRGASTISQQATRNLWLGVDRSLSRKLQEALLTARLEARTDKERILELYINVIELGPDVHGIADAAQYYFGKTVEELSPLQAVHLAALAPAPRRYAIEFKDGTVPDAWMTELHEHLRRMRRARLINTDELIRGLSSELELLDRR